MPITKEMLERRAEMVRTGGSGSVRRTKKAVHRNTNVDDQKIQASLKKLGVNSIGEIEEVNLIHDNGTVTNFSNPKVSASIQSSMYVIAGHGQTKQIEEMMPSIMNQLGSEHLEKLKELAQTMRASAEGGATVEEIPDTESFE
eukprot:NODE_4116_length_860_cov_68.053021_g3798_i0.p2 GENE.NODE_4116_length_860_cov_68.053021_g3798_i0~~NODE_4116_length_860_cov_68.053021_g3798_i0.p2  ORF type:complete len:143 (+),score=40.85 NODE_4116_length_860_cov_68.053021_g3798_i0:88-516(+)